MSTIPITETTVLPLETIKSLPFKVTDVIQTNFKTRFLTINFNNAGFVKEAGYDDNDFSRRVDLLAKFLKTMIEKYNVSLINMQELSSRYMHLETVKYKILSKLFEVSKSWTATPPIGRHGDSAKCLNLVTFWNADILHLNSLHNVHFSKSEEVRDVGNTLCADKNVFATSNAILMDMSFTVPAVQNEFHCEGKAVDNSAKVMNVNVHMPLRGCLKLECMKKIKHVIDAYQNIDSYFVSISGDMNLFFDESDHIDILSVMKEIGTLSARELGDTYALDTLFGKLRSTTFIGMLYDLKNNMKMNINKESFETWIEGDSNAILKTFNKKIGPLDWFIFKNRSWCESTETKVIDINDLIQLGFDLPKIESENLPDYGNYITDHLPLITTINFSCKNIN